MTRLFDPSEGIGLSVLRQPMGASDYARDFYSYNDMPEGETDVELEQFSIAHDEEDIIPLLQEALRLNPDVKLMGSPWSPPGWMKTSGSMIGGELKPEYYSVYANYFVRYIQGYEANGRQSMQSRRKMRHCTRLVIIPACSCARGAKRFHQESSEAAIREERYRYENPLL